MIKTIHLDMDGVIADFDGYVKSVSGMTPDELNLTVPSCHVHSNDDRTDPVYKLMKEHITNHDMFFNISPVEEFSEWKLILDSIHNKGMKVVLLTAAPSASLFDKARDQKTRWVEKHDFGVDGIIVVPSSSEKRKYARTDTLLIDDFEKNIKSYTQSGGLAIHHVTLQQTKKRLDFYLR